MGLAAVGADKLEADASTIQAEIHMPVDELPCGKINRIGILCLVLVRSDSWRIGVRFAIRRCICHLLRGVFDHGLDAWRQRGKHDIKQFEQHFTLLRGGFALICQGTNKQGLKLLQERIWHLPTSLSRLQAFQ